MNSASQRIYCSTMRRCWKLLLDVLQIDSRLDEAVAGLAIDSIAVGDCWMSSFELGAWACCSTLQPTQLHILPWVVTQMWVLQPRHGAYPYLSKKVVTVVVLLISESCAHYNMYASSYLEMILLFKTETHGQWGHEFLSWIARGMRGKRSSGHH
jgi:hypothetical protein